MRIIEVKKSDWECWYSTEHGSSFHIYIPHDATEFVTNVYQKHNERRSQRVDVQNATRNKLTQETAHTRLVMQDEPADAIIMIDHPTSIEQFGE